MVHPRLVRSMSLYCGRPDVAEEIAQDAIAIACRDWKKVREAHSPEAYVHRAAINLANSFFRRKAAERRANQRYGAGDQIAGEPDILSREPVRLAIASLPRRQRTALVMRYYLDLPIAEVANLMGCSEGTVKALTHQAVIRLRQSPELVGLKLKEVSDAG
jgi:RNA polymerase sigma factor (sigma-70 family)